NAEITNCAFRCKIGHTTGMHPLEELLSPEEAAEVNRGIDRTISALIDARFWACDAGLPGRCLLWGVDLVVSRIASGFEVQLLEVNVHPHLFMGMEDCDAPMRQILRERFLPQLNRYRRTAAPLEARL